MHFAFVLPNLAGGGAEKAILKTSLALCRRGNKIDVILFESRIDYPLDPAIRIHVLATKAAHGWFGKRLLAWRLRRLMSRLAPDIVISTLPFADEVTVLAGLPNHWCRIANTLSVEVSRLAAVNPAKAERRAMRYRSLYSRCSLIAVSQGVADDLQKHLQLASPLVTIANPFDLEEIRRAAGESCPERPTVPYVIHVGRFSSQKRHDLLLDAWQQIETDRLLVLLTQPDPRLVDMIAERGLTGRVVIAGFQKNPYPWIAAADLLVLCSDHEGLPNVLIESLICQTPVVSTDCPSGPAEILQNLPAALVPCGDVSALAAKISAFLLQPPDISKVKLMQFSTDITALAYERIAGRTR